MEERGRGRHRRVLTNSSSSSSSSFDRATAFGTGRCGESKKWRREGGRGFSVISPEEGGGKRRGQKLFLPSPRSSLEIVSPPARAGRRGKGSCSIPSSLGIPPATAPPKWKRRRRRRREPNEIFLRSAGGRPFSPSPSSPLLGGYLFDSRYWLRFKCAATPHR